MRKTVGLCFGKKGILNPSRLKLIQQPDSHVDTIMFIGDGSPESLDYIKGYSDSPMLNLPHIRRVGLGITPRYDLRVITADGEMSLPNYVYSDDMRIRWLCSTIAAPLMEIHVSDISSQSGTQSKLDRKMIEAVCYNAHKLWTLLLVVEDQLCFPAVVIDRMMRWTYNLTPQTIDVALLRKETGIASLDYNAMTDLLSITVGGEYHFVKLTLLNDIYGSMILPLFNALYGRRLRLSVAIGTQSGQATDPVDMSYAELGRLIEEMRVYTKERIIDVTTPMDPNDLMTFADRFRPEDENCIWVDHGQSLTTIVDTNYQRLLFRNIVNDDESAGDPHLFATDHSGPTAVNG